MPAYRRVVMVPSWIVRQSALLVLVSTVLLAQSERGAISGAVRDSTGAPVPQAQIVITNIATNQTINVTSSEAGEFTAPEIAVGTYDVRVEKTGFRPTQIHGLTVNAATTARADFNLEIGQSRQVIEVEAAAVQLNSEDSKSSVTINQKLVDTLPLVVGGAVRSPFDLATLTPESKNVGGDFGFSLGGGQGASYGATLDGVSVTTSRALQKSWVSSNAPSVEALTEFTVDTYGYKAEYGHAGGGVMTFVANDFFSNRAGKARQIYKQNDFGATIGGPVWIPKIYNGHNKTFFFFSYEGFRNRNGATNATNTVPTPEMYGGDFSNWVTAGGAQIPIYDPTTQTTGSNGAVTRSQFAGNKIPITKFDAT